MIYIFHGPVLLPEFTVLWCPLFRDVAPGHWVMVLSVTMQHSGLILKGRSAQDIVMLSRNVGHQSPSDAAPHLGRTETSTIPLQKPKNLNFTTFVEVLTKRFLLVIFFGFRLIHQITSMSSSSDGMFYTEAMHVV